MSLTHRWQRELGRQSQGQLHQRDRRQEHRLLDQLPVVVEAVAAAVVEG